MSNSYISEKDFKYIVDKLNEVIRKLRTNSTSVCEIKSDLKSTQELLDYFIDKHKGFEQLIKFQQTRWLLTEQKPLAVNGGTNEIFNWTKRTLTNIDFSSDFIPEIEYVKLNDSVITLRPGLYIIKVSSVFTNSGGTRIRLFEKTENKVLASSVSQHILSSNNSILSISIDLEYRYAFEGLDKDIELQYFATNKVDDMGLGMASGILGENEIYTRIEIEKLG